MQDERKRILDLVEKGVISAAEALDLLEKIADEKSGQTTPTSDIPQEPFKQHTTEKEAPKEQPKQEEAKGDDYFDQKNFDEKTDKEFIDDLKQDFSQFSTKFMDILTNTFSKVRDMDLTGEKRSFTHRFDLGAGHIQDISVKIPNGHVQVEQSTNGTAYVEVAVSPTFMVRNEEVEEEFLKKFTAENDNGTIRITSDNRGFHVNTTLYLPAATYQKIHAELFNGGFTLANINADELEVQTMNGKINVERATFRKIDAETSNGAIEIRGVAATEVDAETINGLVSIDGAFREIEAHSANGTIKVKTTDPHAEKIKAQTTAGTIEVQVPDTVGIRGEASSNFGKIDVQLHDVELLQSQEQFLSKSVRFEKKVDDNAPLVLEAEARTGTVVVRYAL